MTPESYLDTHRDAIALLLKRLIACPTVNPPGRNYDAMTRLLVAELQRVGCETKRLEVPVDHARPSHQAEVKACPRWNVLGQLKGSTTETLHFNAHYDVVPASTSGWDQEDPFSPVIKDGWLYGRGTADMKGSIASLILALESLKATGTTPHRNLEVSFTADEETGSHLGAEWLVRHADIKPDYVIVMEGASRNRVCCGHNGALWLNVTVRGKAVHGSRPHDGINALSIMSRLVLALEDYADAIHQRSFTSPAPKEMHPTLNIGGVFAVGDGAKVNTVPAEASFTLDRRMLPNEDPQEVEAELRALIEEKAKAFGCTSVSIETDTCIAPCFIAPESPFFHTMARQVADVRNEATIFGVSGGFDDIHCFANHLKVPTLGYGPGGECSHAANERASLDELLHSAKIYARMMTMPW